ncbi:metalloregulator ArsR/SmtB family transcription factor [Natronosalvus vescus]|uniref:metalloregulator ArsR/SmtB family transcription factor n=1 Tax=Natronosalvus vescus TaxID=2953881 RepID=UPI002091A0C2|nr:metalloregulator ArsR/SmtB family transcription factor [Natronosalvus vescus]
MVVCSLAVAGTGTAVALVDTSSDQTGEVDDAGSSSLLEVSGLVLDDDLGDTVNDTTNDTDDAVNDTEDTVNETTDDTEDAVNDTEDAINETTDDTEDAVNETTDDTEDAVNETTDDTEDAINETTDDTEDAVNETTDDTEDAVNETTDDTEDAVNETTDDTEDAVNETSETLEETTDSLAGTTGSLEETADETTDMVDDTVGTVGDAVEEASDETTETIDDTVETVDDTVDDTGETLEETTTTLSDTTNTVLGSTDMNATVRTESELADLEATLEANVTTEEGTEPDLEGAFADDETASGPLGISTPEPSSSTQTAVNGILAGLLGAVAVSSMGVGVAGAGAGAGAGATGAGAGAAGSTVASWTGASQLRRWWNLLRDAISVPLAALFRYSRYDDSDPLENDRRKEIFDAVTAEPGLYLSEVSDHSDVPLSTVRHHVRILEEENIVTSIKVDGKRRYFPIDADDVELHAALAEPTRRRLLEELATLGQAPNGQLADALDRDPSTISHHLSKLEESGLVVREREGRSVVNELSPAATTALLDAEASQPRPQPVPADD